MIALRPGDFGLLQYGELSIFFQVGYRAPELLQGSRRDLLLGLAVATSLVVHAAVFAAAFVLMSRGSIPKPAELMGREEIAARFGIRPDLIRPTPGPWMEQKAAPAQIVDTRAGSALSAGDLQDEIKRASERPKFIQSILDIESRALKALREDNVKRASDLFREASQVASKLGDIDTMNEFTKKSQCLMEFYQADQKKKRSF